jgi:hypothetical protein
MKTQQKIKKLSTRKERTEGTFSSFQELGNKFYSEKESSVQSYSPQERKKLYERAIFGLNTYTEEELKKMHWQKKNRIKKVNKRAQRELNLLKQERLIALTNSIFSMFGNSKLATDIVEQHSKPNPKYINNMSLKDLELTRNDVADRLVEKGILPNNF